MIYAFGRPAVVEPVSVVSEPVSTVHPVVRKTPKHDTDGPAYVEVSIEESPSLTRNNFSEIEMEQKGASQPAAQPVHTSVSDDSDEGLNNHGSNNGDGGQDDTAELAHGMPDSEDAPVETSMDNLSDVNLDQKERDGLCTYCLLLA